jgi:hypothetical protein
VRRRSSDTEVSGFTSSMTEEDDDDRGDEEDGDGLTFR